MGEVPTVVHCPPGGASVLHFMVKVQQHRMPAINNYVAGDSQLEIDETDFGMTDSLVKSSQLQDVWGTHLQDGTHDCRTHARTGSISSWPCAKADY